MHFRKLLLAYREIYLLKQNSEPFRQGRTFQSLKPFFRRAVEFIDLLYVIIIISLCKLVSIKFLDFN